MATHTALSTHVHFPPAPQNFTTSLKIEVAEGHPSALFVLSELAARYQEAGGGGVRGILDRQHWVGLWDAQQKTGVSAVCVDSPCSGGRLGAKGKVRHVLMCQGGHTRLVQGSGFPFPVESPWWAEATAVHSFIYSFTHLFIYLSFTHLFI